MNFKIISNDDCLFNAVIQYAHIDDDKLHGRAWVTYFSSQIEHLFPLPSALDALRKEVKSFCEVYGLVIQLEQCSDLRFFSVNGFDNCELIEDGRLYYNGKFISPDEKYRPGRVFDVKTAKSVLLENGYVDHFWDKQDIIDRAEEKEIYLSEYQVNEVMAFLNDNSDKNNGINWETLDVWINYVVNEMKNNSNA